MTADAWFTRLTLKREDASATPLLQELAPPDGGDAMVVGHRLMWSAASSETRAAFDKANPERKDGAAFLWREAEVGRKFYMLGPRPLETSPLFRIETKPFAAAFRVGERLSFELRVNPTVARKGEAGGSSKRSDVAMARMLAEEANGADPKDRAGRRSKAAEDSTRDWLVRIGERDGFTLNGLRLDAYRVERLPRRGPEAKIGVCDVCGALEVTDGERFLARVLAGFGRAKAFGCGLMLLRRLA